MGGIARIGIGGHKKTSPKGKKRRSRKRSRVSRLTLERRRLGLASTCGPQPGVISDGPHANYCEDRLAAMAN